MGSTDEAEARLVRLFARFRHSGVPMWSGDLRSVSDASLERARGRAFDAAAAAGRGDLLADALAFVERGYAQRVSRDTAWTGILALGPSYDGRYRADSQMVLQDLVLAVVVLDVAPDTVTEPLRVDGERLLRITAEEAASPVRQADEGAAADDVGAPRLDPDPGPLVFSNRGLGLGALAMVVVGLLSGAVIGIEAVVAVVLIFGAVLVGRRLMGE